MRACQRIIASRPEDYRAMSSRFEFVSRLGSEFGNANPQDMKKVKKRHGGFEAFVVAHATELFAFTPPPSPGGAVAAPSPEDFSDFILNDVCVGEHVLELLRAQDIGSIETLRMLNLDDLRAIPGLALGPRRKLHEALRARRQHQPLRDMPPLLRCWRRRHILWAGRTVRRASAPRLGGAYSDSAGVIVRFSTGSFTSRPLSEVRIQSADTLQRVDGERSCVKYIPRHSAKAGAPVTAL